MVGFRFGFGAGARVGFRTGAGVGFGVGLGVGATGAFVTGSVGAIGAVSNLMHSLVEISCANSVNEVGLQICTPPPIPSIT